MAERAGSFLQGLQKKRLALCGIRWRPINFPMPYLKKDICHFLAKGHCDGRKLGERTEPETEYIRRVQENLGNSSRRLCKNPTTL